jgi:hypothetical protein
MGFPLLNLHFLYILSGSHNGGSMGSVHLGRLKVLLRSSYDTISDS